MVSRPPTSKIAQFIWKYIENLQQKSEHIGTCAGVIRIQSEASGSGVPGQPCDRFVVAFPFGAQCCKWEVIFDSDMPTESPDFIFINSDQDFLPDFDDLKTLHNWRSEDPDALLEVLRELITMYKLHHMRLIEGTRVEFEMFSLTRCEDLNHRSDGDDDDDRHERCQHFHDSEVYVVKKNNGNIGPIQITVKLPIDFGRLSELIATDTGVYKVLVIVVYENMDGGNITTQICPSANVERALKSVGGTPAIPFPLEGCLHDYVVSVTNQISDLIERFLKSFEKRKQFVHSLKSTFSGYILEFDAVSFSRVHLLVSTETTPTLLLAVNVPPGFPAVQPTLVFTSTGDESTPKSIKDYPYSPRWSSEEMTERLKTFLLENIPLISKEISDPHHPN